jgi:hypothetical protein
MAITQLGTVLKVAFTGNTITHLIMEDVTTEATGVQDIIQDENAATGTILISDLGKRVSFTAIVTDDYADDLPPAQGSLLDIGGTMYRVESASFKQNRKQSTLTVAGIREVSMEATYDA